MDTQALILAAHVRELAVTLRESHGQQTKRSNPDASVRDMPLNDFMGIWRSQHPVEEFVPMALQDLRSVAKLISTIP